MFMVEGLITDIRYVPSRTPSCHPQGRAEKISGRPEDRCRYVCGGVNSCIGLLCGRGGLAARKSGPQLEKWNDLVASAWLPALNRVNLVVVGLRMEIARLPLLFVAL